MKHMGKVHIMKYILLLIIAIGVGVGGYEIGVTHNNNNSKTALESSSSVSSKSFSSTTYNDESEDSETDTTEDSNDNNNNNVNSSSVEEAQSSNTDTLLSNGTFAGYSNIHQLANAGYTVTSYLIEKEGMTPKQAHLYIKQHYSELQNFLTSGEIQTMYSLYGNN